VDNRPIGIFDSGIGGLTVANAVSKLLPTEEIVYFGDTQHMPYGERSEDAIRFFSRRITEFLLVQNCKALVIACNTISSRAYNEVCALVPAGMPVINVIDPVVAEVLRCEMKRVAVIGTKQTIDSDIYAHRIHQLSSGTEVISKATRSLASIIEEGFYQDPKAILAIISYYMDDPSFYGIDGLILGCTHYPIIKEEINAYFKYKVSILDSPAIVSRALQSSLLESSLFAVRDEPGPHHFFVSDFTPVFEETTRIFFGQRIRLELNNIWEPPCTSSASHR